MPSLLRLRRSVIHNDANDHNVLVGADRVTGLIDFGDMVESASVGELAVAATYAMMGCGDPLAVTAELVAGYHEQFPLREDDLAALYPLICARLCLSVVHSARSSAANPDNTYITVSEESAWALISTMLEVQPEAAESTFRAACGLDSDRSHHA
jgi:Ser/Thr protein kinase RdoA (MazF antagonist)